MKVFVKITTLGVVVAMILSLIINTKVNADVSDDISNNQKIFNVAVLLYSFDDSFMEQLMQSLQEIQNRDKVRFTFYDGKNNIAIQNQTLDSVLKSNIDLIILNSADNKAGVIKDYILKVKEKNVPIIIMEASPTEIPSLSKDYDKLAFVGPADTKNAGIEQGKIIVNEWNSHKNVIDKNFDNILQYVMLEGEAENPVAEERTKLPVSTINNAGIKIEELAHINANWFKELARGAIHNLFLKYNGRIEAIIANNDAMAIGAIEALQKYGYNTGDKSKYILVFGIDAIPEARELIDKGIMTGTIIQDSKALAEGLYKVRLNLINKENPIENTNYKVVNGLVEIPLNYQEYVHKGDM
ncbi:D-galactose-binding periplasmic protein precursor [Clostridium sp. DL-VIII]|uniref:galactose ABC transporter substrate-binding protein n=1 Tax=Clostridium sp. DL-VIII TaxID=641107 RepID=UPI00023B00E8|nr:galactose ABC transporter substrate-binding protein [Clostridium sp. DL-VIII]EHI99209.1 D-galactose-binding periplasmic protein precursor [Clostridium sp. DL-VIII]